MEIKKKRIKIAVINSHGDNRGDEAAQRSMIRGIRSLLVEADFTVFTSSAHGLDLKGEARVMETFSPSPKGMAMSVILAFLMASGIKIPPSLRKRNAVKFLEEIMSSSLVISAPGGPYIGDMYPSHEIREHLLGLCLAKIMGKKVMIYAPSMGPFKTWRRNVFRGYVLNGADVITVREKASKKYLETLGVARPLIRLAAESVFQLEGRRGEDAAGIERMMASEGIMAGEIAGISVAGARWNYRGAADAAEKQKRYNFAIAEALDNMIETHGLTFVFLPQLYGRSDDSSLIRDVLSLVKRKDRVKVLPREWDSAAQRGVIKKMKFVVSGRYHPAVFALDAGVPVISIAYEHKAVSLMEEAGMGEFVTSAEDITAGFIVAKAGDILGRRQEIVKDLEENIKPLRERAFLSSKLAAGLLAGQPEV